MKQRRAEVQKLLEEHRIVTADTNDQIIPSPESLVSEEVSMPNVVDLEAKVTLLEKEIARRKDRINHQNEEIALLRTERTGLRQINESLKEVHQH